jgi:hypothetical protein
VFQLTEYVAKCFVPRIYVVKYGVGFTNTIKLVDIQGGVGYFVSDYIAV